MPFFVPANKKIGCVSLQVQKHLKKQVKNKYCSRKRAYLFACEGGITVEATIALSAFMILILFIESFMMVINFSISMQSSINNIAVETAKKKFYLHLADTYIAKNKTLTDLKKELKAKVQNNFEDSKELTELMEEGIKISYLSQRLISEISEEAFHNKLCRISNLKLGKSSVNNEMIDMVVEYKIKIPYINKQFQMVQRGKARAWTGENISQNQREVYITKEGKVYHKTRNCSYLIVKISKAYYSEIGELRNSNGEKYSRCLLCIREKLSDISKIFITEDGNRYHRDLKCSGIKRNVMAVDISWVGNRNPCSKCGQGE